MSRITLASLMSIFFLTCSIRSQEIQSQVSYSGDEYDFSFIDKYVKDKRIVAIGESTHGIGDFYYLKSKLVSHLYNDLGFEILAMEGGFGDLNLAWANIDQFSALELRNNTVFGNFHCTEIEPLFNLLKESSKSEVPLIYTGFDCQISSSYFQNHLDSILQLGDKRLVENLKEGFESYYKIYPSVFEEDSTNFITHRNKFLSAIESVKDFVTANQHLIQSVYKYSDNQMKIINRSLAMLSRSMDIEYSSRFNEENIFRGIVLRDELMFENLMWIIQELYPNKKVVIWGHNAHIQKGKLANSNIKWMGQLLKEEFKDQYYALGLFAYQGNVYQQWTKETIPFERSDSTSIEYILNSQGKSMFTFQNLNDQKFSPNTAWMFKEVSALEIENGGNVSFVPVERFDGVLGLYEVDIPTFGN
jgi:erythromycin esterase